MNIQALQNHAGLGISQQLSHHTKSQPIEFKQVEEEQTIIEVEEVDAPPILVSAPDRVETQTISDDKEADEYEECAIVLK